ncbi:MAG: cysteine desulfurase NifS [Actinobacteria bacterium]|nr:cysteine desulfurase NifS [Actinomycetota bacterium]MCL5735130.1 cysteine desulfurase NifS [Actinomycetota bacterium]
MDNLIYFDHAATTPTDPAVVEAMQRWFTTDFGNPATLYNLGLTANQAMETSRAEIAGLLGAEPDEIYFTSGGTESDNWAIKGVADAHEKKGRHLITSTIEHHAVLDTMEYLEKKGFEVTRVRVDSGGLVDPDDVRKAIRPDTILISIMHANNEVGTIEPISAIGEIAREAGVIFHTDAVQTVGKLPVNVDDLNVDILSLSGHKFYGPKGVGATYLRKRVRVTPLMHGGGQERRRRAGTQNVPGIVGLAKALQLATDRMAEEAVREQAMRDRLWQGLQESIPDIWLNGHPTERLANSLNFRVEGIEGEAMILCLDMNLIGVSSGSACTTGSLEPSHVLLAMGIPAELAHGSLRLTLGRDNTDIDIAYFLDVFPPVVKRLRDMSPVYNK